MFSSNRERRLWLYTLLVVGGIYATLGLASRLAGMLRDQGLLESTFLLGMALIGLAVLTQGLTRRPTAAELGVFIGIGAVYLLAFVRIATPEERTHLIEYGVVGVLIYEALTERRRNGGRGPAPALLSVAITAALGAIDEGIQFLLPERVFDVRDLGFNALAGVLGVGGMTLLRQVRPNAPDA